MAKKRKKSDESKQSRQNLVCLQPNTAGIDIAKDVIQVCVPTDRDEDNNREFGAYTADLHSIAKWLKSCHIERCIMEATGIYWVQLFNLLDKYGFETILVNPAEVKNYTARKSDVSDAEWLMFIGSHGLYKNSFHTNWWVDDLKNLSRHRQTLIEDSAREILHMQKAMEFMNIKLSSVLSDITGESGMAIIKAILEGERDPKVLVNLVNYRCKTPREEIAKALEGTWNRVHMIELRHAWDLYHRKRAQILECENEMENIIRENIPDDEDNSKSFKRADKQKQSQNPVSFDIEKLSYDTWHVNAMTIPGIGDGAVLRLLSELGPDFVQKFSSASKFCRWCNVAPTDEISGGKVLSCHVQKRKNLVGQVFRQAVISLHKSQNALGIYYRKMKSRFGPRQANVNTAHKIATIFYTMVKTGNDYIESLTAASEEKMLKKRIQRLEKDKLRLQNKLAAIGAVI